MFATTANSIWPATWPVTVQAVAYAQVGDFFKMLVQRKPSAFAACEFCRTLNSQYAVRCRTCGGSLSPPGDEESASETARPKETKSSSSDSRALRSVLGMVLVPPLVMFVGFGVWHQLQFDSYESAIAPAKPTPQFVHEAANRPRAAVSVQQGVVSDREAVKDAALLVSQELRAVDAEESSPAPRIASPASSTSATTPRSTPSRNKDVIAGLSRQRQDPLAGCTGLNFLARAVCINSRCAEPKTARLGQCREAVRQRRIDEARRNPVLMG